MVRQNLTVPTTYTPIPLSEATTVLFEQRTNELDLMTKKAKALTKKFNPAMQTVFGAKPCFGIITEGDRGKKYQAAIQQTQRTLQATCSWLRFRKTCFLFETQLKDALKRDVAIRILTQKNPNYNLPKWVNCALQRYPNFQLKTVPAPPLAAVTLFDEAQAVLAFNPEVSVTKGPDLWSTNPALVAVCQAYFNDNWP